MTNAYIKIAVAVAMYVGFTAMWFIHVMEKVQW